MCNSLATFKKNEVFSMQCDVTRAVARALIGGGGGEYSYIQVLPD